MADRDEEAVARFVARFADTLVEGGVPRMPARVFARLLVTDSGRLTAAELAESLNVSPGAVSGAVRYLIGVDLIRREHEPGSRRDVYAVHRDLWYEGMLDRTALLKRWSDVMSEGLEALPPDSQAAARLATTRDFFDYLMGEMPAMLQRWRQVRDAAAER